MKASIDEVKIVKVEDSGSLYVLLPFELCKKQDVKESDRSIMYVENHKSIILEPKEA